jgi:hypothetical protein
MGVIQIIIVPVQTSPPIPKSTGTIPWSKESIQHDPVRTIVCPRQIFGIRLAQLVCHLGFSFTSG